MYQRPGLYQCLNLFFFPQGVVETRRERFDLLPQQGSSRAKHLALLEDWTGWRAEVNKKYWMTSPEDPPLYTFRQFVLFIYLDPVLTRTQVFPLFRRYLPIALIIPYHTIPTHSFPSLIACWLARSLHRSCKGRDAAAVGQAGRQKVYPTIQPPHLVSLHIPASPQPHSNWIKQNTFTSSPCFHDSHN